MTRRSILALTLTLAACADAPRGAAVAPCHDEARGIVQMTRAAQCAGRIVSEEEAAALRAADAAERRARMARSLAEEARLARLGLRLASAGTGFAVSETGDLLTSAHVVAGCDAVEARGGVLDAPTLARLRAQDDALDLAVLRIKARTPERARFAPTRPANAEPLALVGYPKEGLFRVEPRLTPVTASYALSDPLRTGALGLRGDVRQGNSGGPVLDSRGRVAGVLRSTVDTVRAHRETGALVTNLAKLIDARPAAAFLERARTRYAIDGGAGVEKSGRELFQEARRYVYRIDCLKRR